MASLQQIKTLLSVQTHGGIHAAARELHLSPSAVSQQLKCLGSECGFPLVEQEGRGVRLTEGGEGVARIGWQMAELWEQTIGKERERSGSPKPKRHVVRLGAFPSALQGCVLPAIGRRQRLPFDLELFETSPSEGRDLVQAGTLDAAVSVQGFDAREDPRFRVSSLRRDPFVLAAPPSLLAMADRSSPARGLAGLPWVLPQVGSDCDRLITMHVARHGIAVRPVGRTDDWGLAQEMAVALRAAVYVPSSVADHRPELAHVDHFGGVPAPVREVVLTAKATATANGWFSVLHRLLRRTYDRNAGAGAGVAASPVPHPRLAS
ncbi:LysR family transcriptional regulator [Streptomyces sp. YIM 103828]|uniref:LysR family transcriptional regulator n=1 Tax=Streptomyces sp. YIM 103828 TaxID=3158968 RepID=UPI0032D92B4F